MSNGGRSRDTKLVTSFFHSLWVVFVSKSYECRNISSLIFTLNMVLSDFCQPSLIYVVQLLKSKFVLFFLAP